MDFLHSLTTAYCLSPKTGPLRLLLQSTYIFLGSPPQFLQHSSTPRTPLPLVLLSPSSLSPYQEASVRLLRSCPPPPPPPEGTSREKLLKKKKANLTSTGNAKPETWSL